MDGINPTLAFAALFFGLAGHPHDAAESSLEQTSAEQPQIADGQVWDASQCSDFVVAVQGNDAAYDALGHGAAIAWFFPDTLEEDATLIGARNSMENPAPDDQAYQIALESSLLASGPDVALDMGAFQDFRMEAETELHDAGGCGDFSPQP